LLVDIQGVLSVAQIGSELRLLASADNAMRARVTQRLAAAGIDAEVALAQPNLEDVFVAATHGRSKERAA